VHTAALSLPALSGKIGSEKLVKIIRNKYIERMKRGNYPAMVWESVVRGVALWVIILSVAGAWLGSVWIPLFMAIDFFIRALVHPRYSPVALLSRRASSRLFRKKDVRIFFTPKRFAAKIGLLISVAASLFFLFGLPLAGSGALLMLGLFSFLECFLRYCAGCKIFALLAKHDLVDTSDCPGCVR
jgi:hypothetical protein